MDQQINKTIGQEDLLMLALARHDGPYSSTAWSLAKAFAAEGRVWFIDNPFTLTDYFKKEKQPQIKKRYGSLFRRKISFLQPEPSLPQLKVLVPPLMLPVNWLPKGRWYSLFSRINHFLLRRSVNKMLKEMQFQDFVFLNSFNPFYGARPSFAVSPKEYIYQTVDNIGESKYVGKHGPELEKECMRQAGFVLTTSIQLKERANPFNREVYCLPNAADIGLFNQAVKYPLPLPAELEQENRKIICYTGHIDHRLDYSMLIQVARQHSDKLFLMVGPTSGSEWTTSGFADLTNVVFTGKKKLEELPAYLQHAHCTLIPFKCNELTASIYPLKINEYLAAGKPVVSTPFSADIIDFKEVIKLADSGESFGAAIQEALEQDSGKETENRLLFAADNTWQKRAETFRKLIWKKKRLEESEKTEVYEEAVR